jgi:hypothetical protein
MEIFVGNLPADGRLIDLQEVLQGHKLHTRFEMHTGTDAFDRDYHYFIVVSETDDEGLALIERLNGMLFNGNRLTAREFIRRSDSTEPAVDWNREERRINKPKKALE